ncbi:ABCB family ABC transporter ATP-binding protein/permease [Roseiterribacter gracilis]|uniref:ABC transporter ATP-binding protein n=1 Tax=Roseiterribacter gracilis TaxID=2812848 RepID=A0A8S8XCA7_9PROT|nr:ABC transporter ATP-binding protein [Rhodospirillales bacterium TMPK1]
MTPPITPPPEKSSGDLRTIRSLLPYLWPANEPGLRLRVVLAVFCLLLAKAANVTIPLVYGRAVDALSPGREHLALLPLTIILGYGLARLSAALFDQLRSAVFQHVAQRAIRRVALTVFRHLHALSLRFHVERQTGGLSRSIERGTNAIDNILSFALFNVVPTLVELALAAGILWHLFGVNYAIATVATVGIYIFYTIKVANWRMSIRRAMNESDSAANTKAIDSLLNAETVKYFVAEEHEARRYDEALAKYERHAVRTQTSLAWLNIGQSFIIALGLTVVMTMSAYAIEAGEMSVGDFVLVNTYLLQLAAPLGVFGWVYSSLKQGLVDMEKMFELLRVDREVADKPGAQPLQVRGGEVAFENIRFGYDPRREILHGVSFRVPAGKTLAIVGPTGAGKSTISRLLFRFYDAADGRVTIDGQDVRDVTQTSVRGAIGIVPQDTVLFNDTIYYNIAYGRPGATKEAIEHAARMAEIHDFVMTLPDGYETKVGERGLKLSGGEKQRVAIARALLKDPPIMLFDEATSALDTATERGIQANLRAASSGRTTLIIAHRLSTVIDADEIVVLEKGRVAERGTFDQLRAADGIFATMWAKQQEQQNLAAQSAAPGFQLEGEIREPLRG